MNSNWQKTEQILKKDGVVILPTDTLYGIVGKAMSKKVVERIYKIKGRNEKKPFIVLITSYKDLDLFGVKIGDKQAKILEKFWPGKVSIILSCSSRKFEYLHRGTKSIAFRMIGPKNKNLFNLLKKVGPIVAPSANPEGDKPAETISKAKKYFGPVRNREGSQRLPISNGVGGRIDLYINGGLIIGKPSTLVKFNNDKLIILRQGEIVIK